MPEKPEHHEEDNIWVGERIRTLRRDGKLSQTDLAVMIGDANYQKYISNYENGVDHMPIAVFFAIMEALRASPIDLLPPRLYGKNRNVFDDYMTLNAEHQEAVSELIHAPLKAENKS